MPEETFFQYLDASGAVHIVDRLEKVPQDLRAKARKIELPSGEAAAVKEALGTIERLERSLGSGAEAIQGRVEAMTGPRAVEPSSFGLGFVSAMVLATLLWVVRGTAKLALKLAVLAVLGVLASGLYFGYLRRSAGLSDKALSAPGELIDDAKEAAERLDARRKSTEKELQ